ncbi:dihydroxyacetone kinase transcriptional activator DhaS [Paenibacillus sp. ACRRX]|uniref:dihydroxyacetone kinase transcriptional activator DhaS n=1 Tax=Paenibacillus sp. ACRRX TaxID=2918206 RepID=UPI001EF724A5|nr:dihydroxyacetone kinase transcriptional activator DhaS [Paenibacillus sp. ACRRX]MCG7408730.1 dihydroxyacetone kinase transcriptional activator DhaS [Paenibacillus sp. ACRRX]
MSSSSSLLTKKALASSLKDMMIHAPLSKITVQHITNNCGLNRQTFYYHFQDVYELLGWIYKTEAVESIAQYRSYTTWTSGLQKIFDYITRNKAFCSSTLDSLARPHLDTYLYSVTSELMMDVINEVSSNMSVKDDDKHFISNFYTLAFTGLVIQWLEQGMKEDPAVIIAKLSELVEGNFVTALHRYENRHH